MQKFFEAAAKAKQLVDNVEAISKLEVGPGLQLRAEITINDTWTFDLFLDLGDGAEMAQFAQLQTLLQELGSRDALEQMSLARQAVNELLPPTPAKPALKLKGTEPPKNE